jgi:hypothetical protein
MRRFGGLLALTLLISVQARAGDLAEGFLHPPADARPMVRWWWFGGAVEDDELAREIRAMKAGGFGGFEIQPVYPLAVDGDIPGVANTPYLSGAFLKAVSFANTTGRAEGLRVDVTLGSGWPFGGPWITPELASSAIKLNKINIPAQATGTDVPTPTAGQAIVAAFLGTDVAHAAPVDDTGHVTFAAADHDRTLFVLLQAPTGQQVKRAAIGAEGLVLDHMNTAAVQRHLDVVGEPLLRAFGDTPPYAVFSDSLEVYGVDWTGDILPEFRKRRGYDLKPHLLELFNDSPESAAIRRDWGLTLNELVEERYLSTVDQWALAHHTRFRAQVYGTPPVTMSSNRLVALPEGENPDWRSFTTMRWASSANHAYGNIVTSAESWTWLHGGAFRATPLDIKAEADTLVLEGVNQFVAHGWPYSPPQIPEPGWAFYAAAVFNDHNPWWGVMPDITLYLQRISFLMRQGAPEADVAVFLPEDDALAEMKPGQATIDGAIKRFVTPGLTAQILDAGYGFDYVDAESIKAKGVGHKVLILPRVSRLTPQTAKAIADFAKAGGTVIAVDRLPECGPGFVNLAADTATVKALSAMLFPHGVVAEAQLGAALKAAIRPDLTGAPAGIGFVHRHLDKGDLYFVANTNNRPVTVPLTFRAQTKSAQWWDPRTGDAHVWTPGTPVTLQPYESRIFVFGAAADAPVVTEVKTKPVKTGLDGGWTLAFAGQHPQPLPAPTDWTANPVTAHFSGTAVYRRTLKLTKAQVQAGEIALDFGQGTPVPPQGPRQPGTSAALTPPVREAAEVFVNGQRAGAVWTPPFVVSLKGLVHAGDNALEIRVSNTAINELAGRPPADYTRLNATFGERFSAQGMSGLKPLPSGLLQTPVLETAP